MLLRLNETCTKEKAKHTCLEPHQIVTRLKCLKLHPNSDSLPVLSGLMNASSAFDIPKIVILLASLFGQECSNAAEPYTYFTLVVTYTGRYSTVLTLSDYINAIKLYLTVVINISRMLHQVSIRSSQPRRARQNTQITSKGFTAQCIVSIITCATSISNPSKSYCIQSETVLPYVYSMFLDLPIIDTCDCFKL